jgi:hypothetical protein
MEYLFEPGGAVVSKGQGAAPAIATASRFCNELGRPWLAHHNRGGLFPSHHGKAKLNTRVARPDILSVTDDPLIPHTRGLSPAALIHYSHLDGRFVMP